ncbi:hypothetical protein VTJ49DRAFT_1513 [Mycothermus thermophilus]|uniref:Hemerythrin-like domain-containing protein n=1 Tax=Humicola insolens TaxID=85995 RepID=A0ABR3VCP2_HUMIN
MAPDTDTENGSAGPGCGEPGPAAADTVEPAPADNPAPSGVSAPEVPSQSERGTAPEEPALPPLTPQEFRIYNRLAEKMDYFHEHFRQMYTTLQTACATNRRPAGMSLKQFLDEGLNLVHYLETHHSIEETYLYPLLARKMPEFRATAPPSGSSGSAGGKGKGPKGKGKKEECELIRQHREIHEGMDQMAEYLRKCKSKECEFEMGVLKEKMEGWGEVLLRHLDDEVRELGAEKMRRYWTVAEMKSIPI